MPIFKTSQDIRYELNKFKEYMREQEYTNLSVIRYCAYLSRFLQQYGLLQANTIKESVETFLKTERTGRSQTFNGCRAALRLYYRMVSGGNLDGNSEISSVPEIAVILQRFRKYSLEVKHIEESTIISEVSHICERQEKTDPLAHKILIH